MEIYREIMSYAPLIPFPYASGEGGEGRRALAPAARVHFSLSSRGGCVNEFREETDDEGFSK